MGRLKGIKGIGTIDLPVSKLDAVVCMSDSLVKVAKINAIVYMSDSLIKLSRMLDEDEVSDENIISFYVDDKSNKTIAIVKK